LLVKLVHAILAENYAKLIFLHSVLLSFWFSQGLAHATDVVAMESVFLYHPVTAIY
jgi:hypothetical protein